MNALRSMPRRRLLRSAAAALMAGTGVARASFELRPWPPSRGMPALRLEDLDGREWTLAALRGRPVVLNFWATWCEPCRAEMPSLDLMALKYERQGLVVLTVNFRESAPSVRRFLDAVPLSLPVLLDRDGATARAFGVAVFPTTLMVSRLGRPLAEVRGEVDWTGDEGRRLVEALLGA